MEVGGIGSLLIAAAFVNKDSVNVGGRWKRSSSHGFFCGKIKKPRGVLSQSLRVGISLQTLVLSEWSSPEDFPAASSQRTAPMATDLDPRALVAAPIPNNRRRCKAICNRIEYSIVL